MKIFGFGKGGKDRVKCIQDEKGIIHCELRERFPDGSETEPSASADFMLDERCRKVPLNLEGDEDSLSKLSKAANKYIRQECLNRPSDY